MARVGLEPGGLGIEHDLSHRMRVRRDRNPEQTSNRLLKNPVL